jgi:outer membrane protein
MKFLKTFLIMAIFLTLFTGNDANAQKTAWNLDDCINYALGKNIQIQKAGLNTDRNQLNATQALNNRLPSVSGSVRQNFNAGKSANSVTGEWSSMKGSNSTSYGVSSSISLYNGNKLANRIKQAGLDLESSRYYSETIKESVGLNILNAFLQVLYAGESVKNNQKQVEAITGQLALAQERLNLSVISTSDYLQIKSELASEKLTLANSQNQLTLAKVTLEQLMELPVIPDFEVVAPSLDSLLNKNEQPIAQEVYNLALTIKPQIKNAELTRVSAKLDVKIAQADLLPTLSVDAGLSSGYSGTLGGFSYFNQVSNKIAPSAGVSISVPVFQKQQAKTNISLAKITVNEAELDEINTKNELRKSIEQACTDVTSAQIEYAASQEKYKSQLESDQVSTQKFQNGLMNSVDYLFEKTNLITAESQFLQSKYNLIFSYKVVDFYKGISISL